MAEGITRVQDATSGGVILDFLMNSRSEASSSRSSPLRQFLARGIILTFVFTVLIALVGGLFEDSSDSDFNPTNPGTAFAAYHMALGLLLWSFLIPVLVLQSIDHFSGMNLGGHDMFCYVFSAVCNGFMVAAIWTVLKRYRSYSSVRKATNQEGNRSAT